MSVEKIAHQTWGRRREGWLCGALAGALAVGAEVLLRTIAGLPSLAELLGNQGIGLIPGSLFEFFLAVFGHSAKYLYFAGLLLAQVAGFSLLGGLAFSARALLIGGRALSAAREQQQVEEATATKTDEEAPVAASDEEQRADEELRRAASAAALPRIQAPVGWSFGGLLGVIAWVLSGALVLPLLGAGFFGANTPIVTPVVLLSLAVPALVFGATLPAMQRLVRPLAPQVAGSPRLRRAFSPTRRLFLKRVSIGLVVLGAGSLVWQFITQGFSNGNAAGANSLDGPPPPARIVPPPIPEYGAWQPVSGETPELTATKDFYIVSKNIYSDPNLDAGAWRLTIAGEGVMQPQTLTYQDLLKLPTVEQITTLECISNPIGGSLMSNARWKGVLMKDVLALAGIKPGTSTVVFHASDDYTDSIHLSKALDPMTLLVHTINDAPLPPEHGFPARVIAPGMYGMKQCKWLTQIELTNQTVQGYWQERGWNDDALINLGARIDVPLDSASVALNRQTFLAGVAFAGAKGVSAVDVSTDNGHTWQRATLKQPLGAVTWTLWELPWTPTRADTYKIVARMIDLAGEVQQPVLADPYPSGASGYHRIYVKAG